MCANLLRDHGVAYAQWAGGRTSGGGPLQVARAALLMPPPFETPSSAIRAILVPLLETGLVTLEQAETSRRDAAGRVQVLESEVARVEADNSRLQQMVASLTLELQLQRQVADRATASVTTLEEHARELEAAAAEADCRAAQLEQAMARLEQDKLRLQQQVSDQAKTFEEKLESHLGRAEKRWAAEFSTLQDVTAAAQRSEAALHRRSVRVTRLLEELRQRFDALSQRERRQHSELRQLDRLVSSQAEALRSSDALVTELRRRPAVDGDVLRHCLAAAANSPDRRVRRTASKLMEKLG